jgi:malate dehydrogenase
MVEAVLRDERRVLPCCTLLSGQYGVSDAFAGVPVTLGAGGVEAIHEFSLSDDEAAGMRAAGEAVLELVAATPTA